MNDLPEYTSARVLIAMAMADVQIFLLMDESQEEFNSKTEFSRDDILNQLMKTANKFNDLDKIIDLDKPIPNAKNR